MTAWIDVGRTAVVGLSARKMPPRRHAVGDRATRIWQLSLKALLLVKCRPQPSRRRRDRTRSPRRCAQVQLVARRPVGRPWRTYRLVTASEGLVGSRMVCAPPVNYRSRLEDATPVGWRPVRPAQHQHRRVSAQPVRRFALVIGWHQRHLRRTAGNVSSAAGLVGGRADLLLAVVRPGG